jgi:hypothetical protein
MNEQEYNALVAKLGTDAANKIKSEMEAYKSTFQSMIDASKAGTLSADEYNKNKTAMDAAVEEVKSILSKQGTTMQEVLEKLDSKEMGSKSIADQLKADEEELRDIYKSHGRNKTYMLHMNTKGEWVMRPYDTTKAAGPHASVGNVGGAGNTSSIAQTIDATAILRMGGNAPIQSAYRNNPWIFPLVNLINVGFENPFFTWFEEQVKQGASATVLEGAAKPLVQYAYTLKSSQYKKEAMLVGFTEEFSIDFARLQSDIMAKAQVDLINRINSAILPNIIAAATAFNIGATYSPAADELASPNDWDVIAAMAAQAEQATFSTQANAAIVSTIKKYRMGTMRDAQGQWLNKPEVLNGIDVVSNPEQAAQAVMVGDFKNYNVALRGGIIVRVGYNGTDFANNMFSTVIEQFYFDYISALRAPAIVKGPDFATVKAAIVAA